MYFIRESGYSLQTVNVVIDVFSSKKINPEPGSPKPEKPGFSGSGENRPDPNSGPDSGTSLLLSTGDN